MSMTMRSLYSGLRQTITTISLLVAATGAWAAESALTVSCDQPTGVYVSGQPAVFTVARSSALETAPVATVKILRNNRDVVLTEVIAAGEQTHAVRFTPKADGWYVCSVTLPGEEKKPVASTGVVFNPNAYTPSMPAPADFDAFWAAQKARLAAEKIMPVLTPLTPEQRTLEAQNPDRLKKITDLEKAGFTYVNVEIPCLDVKPVRGYYAKPKDGAVGGHPAILYFRAAGVDGGWCRSSLITVLGLSSQFNALVIDMNAHGMLNGQPQEYYTALAKGELSGYQNQGKESRDTFYFLGMFLRLKRAIDFLCAQPEWDGKHLICIGISQGGAQTLAAAGLDSRVSAAVATVPGMCDLTGPVAGNPAGWPGLGNGPLDDPQTQSYIDTVRYFDAVNFCARSHAKTLITVGFVDTTCPAPGVFTAYNQLKSDKRIIAVPDKNHLQLSSPTRELQAEYDAFVLAHIKN
jgi:cephalosporin-C deacetylase